MRGASSEEREAIKLEIIVQTVDDARAAQEGGADRLEVVRAIQDGGLTPPLTLVTQIARVTALPLRVMLRENSGFDAAPDEVATMQNTLRELAGLGIDGMVAGFARTGRLTLDLFDDVFRAAATIPVTFHRAFDSLLDPHSAIDALRERQQIDHILTSGGEGSAVERCVRLKEYVSRAGSGIEIIAGGGVDLELFRLLVERRIVREIHVGRAARDSEHADGPVSAASVRRLRNIADGLAQ